MATDDLNFGDLDELVDEIKTAGVKSVDRDASKIRPPGVWVRFDEIELQATLTTLRLKVTLHLVVTNSVSRGPSEKALASLFNKVKTVVENHGGATGPIKPIGLKLPNSQTPLPCLQIPLALLCTN